MNSLNMCPSEGRSLFIPVSGIQAACDFFRATPLLLQLFAGCMVIVKVTTVVSWN